MTEDKDMTQSPRTAHAQFIAVLLLGLFALSSCIQVEVEPCPSVSADARTRDQRARDIRDTADVAPAPRHVSVCGQEVGPQCCTTHEECAGLHPGTAWCYRKGSDSYCVECLNNTHCASGFECSEDFECILDL